MGLDIDVVIVAGFLLLTVFVGLGHGSTIRTIKDYALGGRNFSTGALIATIVATWASGSGFFITMSKTYSEGLVYVLPAVAGEISFVVMALWLIPRMGEFLGKTSIAEAMGDLYGSKVRIITAIAGAIGSAGLIAVQFKVFGNLFSYFLYIPSYLAILIAGIIVTIYSAFGGIRAVTFTDILQFVAFGVIIPLVGFIIWNHFYNGGFSVAAALNDQNFNIGLIFSTKNPELFGMITMFIYFAIPTFSAPAFQRIAMGKDLAQVKTAFIISGLILVLVNIIIAWIPFLVYSMNPSLGANDLLGHIIDNYSYTGLKGFIVVAVIAFAMSTADSRINATSVLFTNDICKVLISKFKNEIVVSRLFSLFLGTGAILLSLFETDLLEIVVFANSFYYPIVTPPFLFTVLGFRSSGKAVLIGMFAGFVATIFYKIVPIKLAGFSSSMIGVLFSMLCNTVFLIGSHYFLTQPGGWIGIKDRKYLDEQKLIRQQKRETFLHSVNAFNIKTYLRQVAPKSELAYTMLGIYFIIYTFTTMYSTHFGLLKANSDILLVIYQVMMITGTVISMYPIWPLSIKRNLKEKIIHIWWLFSIFYMLIFLSCLFTMISNFSMLQSSVFSINLMIAALLLGWKLAIILIPLGFYFGIKFYYCFFNIYEIDTSFDSPEFILMYVVMLIATTLVIFLKPKQEYLETTERQVGTLETQTKVLERDIFNFAHENYSLANKVRKMDYELEERSIRAQHQESEIQRLGAAAEKILNNVNHELRLPVGNVMNFSEMLRDAVEKYDKEQLKELTDEVYKNSTRLSSMILNMLDLATLNVQKVDLRKTLVNLSEIVMDRVSTCWKVYLQDKPINFDLSVQEEVMVSVDPNYMRQTIDNLVINAIKFSEKGLVKISLTEENGQIKFTITDQGKGIPRGELSDIFQAFKIGSNSESKASGRGVGLALCKAVIEAHGGEIKAESNGKNWSMFTFVLPLKT